MKKHSMNILYRGRTISPKRFVSFVSVSFRNRFVYSSTAVLIFFSLMIFFSGGEDFSEIESLLMPKVSAGSVYHNLAVSNFGFNLTAANVNLITANDNWSGISSVEGYIGDNLAAEGVDPQTVLGTEFPGGALPSTVDTQVNANKSNPDAYNAGGITEFDTGTYISLAMQGTGTADNPYLVMYLNTLGRSSVTVSYNVTDIDGGSNNAVSPVALQYRVGETGSFTNIPAAFIADATTAGVGTSIPVSVVLPASCNNQAKVQVRIIANNPAGQGEWIGVNNITATSIAPTAANSSISGRVFTNEGNPLSRTAVNLYDSFGNIRSVQTNSFGFYSFGDLPTGETYIVEVRSKRYLFANPTQVITLTDDLLELNFYAGEIPNTFRAGSQKNLK